MAAHCFDASARTTPRPGNGRTISARRFSRYTILSITRFETELGFARGFYGLIAEGWDIAETTGKVARGPLPNEAAEVESAR